MGEPGGSPVSGAKGGVPPSVEPLFMLDPEPSGVQRAVAF